MKTNILKTLAVVGLLTIPLSSHAGFTSGLIVGHLLTDKNGNAVPQDEYVTSYNPNFQIKCQSYTAITHNCYVSGLAIPGVKPISNSTYDIRELATEFLHLKNPVVSAVHIYQKFTIVDFRVIKSDTGK